jgi:hypothetical protein
MSLAVTPTNSSNILHILTSVSFSGSASSSFVTCALFQDTTVDAMSATGTFIATGGGSATVTFSHYMVAGTTSATTFKVRVGASASATITFNGSGGAQRYNGTSASSIRITEYTV